MDPNADAIETVAWQMALADGLNPGQSVRVPASATLTAGELAKRLVSGMHVTDHPMDAPVWSIYRERAATYLMSKLGKVG